jgi:hypothetical protein
MFECAVRTVVEEPAWIADGPTEIAQALNSHRFYCHLMSSRFKNAWI